MLLIDRSGLQNQTERERCSHVQHQTDRGRFSQLIPTSSLSLRVGEWWSDAVPKHNMRRGNLHPRDVYKIVFTHRQHCDGREVAQVLATLKLFNPVSSSSAIVSPCAEGNGICFAHCSVLL
ncbi:hypothetical protein CBR_g39014 [Chara braunii]|uniref:Uncharacterized protein n=1 Tax=Chara braunii TaxID=69332 RepID=A0A388K165_CHABU|nr:hypothetical protein CBR_g39014 [Chara braunii]|eukprot:GBG63703.1 hypothetical protein CBR_g39014 [Chara braunii]